MDVQAVTIAALNASLRLTAFGCFLLPLYFLFVLVGFCGFFLILASFCYFWQSRFDTPVIDFEQIHTKSLYDFFKFSVNV